MSLSDVQRRLTRKSLLKNSLDLLDIEISRRANWPTKHETSWTTLTLGWEVRNTTVAGNRLVTFRNNNDQIVNALRIFLGAGGEGNEIVISLNI